ncbi:hypothetical protein FRB99_003169 [Tulasnella sp. 403]|nr:hypothetical protein FRB99_003169 [Tulasnella sp. 403]
MPTHVQGSNERLPPSFFAMSTTVQASVRYSIRVSVVRCGFLRQNEKVETVFLYLPKTRPPVLPPPSWHSYAAGSSDAKPPIESPEDRCAKEWKVVSMSGKGDLDIRLCFLKPLVYQAGSSIPFTITVFSPAASTHILSDLVISSAQVSLVKRIEVNVHGRVHTQEQVLGLGVLRKPESPAVSRETVRIANGVISGGREHGEVSWGLEGLVQVKYAIRVDIKPSVSLDGVIPTCHYQQPIELTTHSADDPESALVGPALGITRRL